MFTTDTPMSVLKDHSAIALDIRIWSGRRKLVADDLPVDADKLPPEQLASLGSKKLIDPAKLKVFSTIRSRVASNLGRESVRFLGGYLVPNSRLPGIVAMLGAERDVFETAKKDFVSDYAQGIDAWCAQNPEWAEMIRRSSISADEAARAISFGWVCYGVTAVPGGKATAEINASLCDATAALGRTMLDDVSQQAREMATRVLAGRDEIGQKALRPLRAIREKLLGLTGVSAMASPLADFIGDVTERLPKSGTIAGPDLDLVRNAVSVLQDQQRMVSLSWRISDGEPVNVVTAAVLAEAAATDVPADIVAESEAKSEPVIEPEPMALVANGGMHIESCGLW